MIQAPRRVHREERLRNWIPAWPKRFTEARDQRFDLPPHVKPVRVVDYRTLDMSTDLEAWCLSWLSDLHMDSQVVRRGRPIPTRLPQSDIAALLRAGVIEQVQRDAVEAWGTLFSVVELHKNRRRIIFWPKLVNEAVWEYSDHSFPFDLGLPEDHFADVHEGTAAASIDLAVAFYQNELAPAIRPYFGFMGSDGIAYQFTRLPMGYVPSCTVQQAVTTALARKAAEVRTKVYIDGIRFVGGEEAVDQAIGAVAKACDAAGAAYEVTHRATTHEWLGVLYDYTAKSVAINDKLREKIVAIKHSIDTWTIAHACRAFGYLFFASRVTNLPLAKYYHAIKFYAARCRAVQQSNSMLEEPAAVWPSVMDEIKTWCDNIVELGPRAVDRRECANAMIISDASSTGWGAIVIVGSMVEFLRGEFTEQSHLHINVTELLAVRNSD
jgi:hypothetical protein